MSLATIAGVPTLAQIKAATDDELQEFLTALKEREDQLLAGGSALLNQASLDLRALVAELRGMLDGATATTTLSLGKKEGTKS
jgi:ABC-type transporter Mla subunit MlaD